MAEIFPTSDQSGMTASMAVVDTEFWLGLPLPSECAAGVADNLAILSACLANIRTALGSIGEDRRG